MDYFYREKHNLHWEKISKGDFSPLEKYSSFATDV